MKAINMNLINNLDDNKMNRYEDMNDRTIRSIDSRTSSKHFNFMKNYLVMMI